MSRPKTRGECLEGIRPCPFIGCRHHLGIDVSGHGPPLPAFGFRRSGDEEIVDSLERMPETCSLDVADRGPHGLASIARLIGISRERARQIEAMALFKANVNEESKEKTMLIAQGGRS